MLVGDEAAAGAVVFDADRDRAKSDRHFTAVVGALGFKHHRRRCRRRRCAVVFGEVVVAGFTDSTNLPGTTGGAQPANGGSYDGFVARLSSNLATLEKATYLGGADYERVTAIALDPAGNVFITGYTASTNLPGSAGGAQAGNGGGNDAFVAKLTLDLRSDPIFFNGFD